MTDLEQDLEECEQCGTLLRKYLIEPEPGYVALRYRVGMTDAMVDAALERWEAGEDINDDRWRMQDALIAALRLCVADYDQKTEASDD